jgi:hypothetical protein
MSLKICVSANNISYPQGGGHMWVFLNWCLGLKEIDCDVIWLEGIEGKTNGESLAQLSGLQSRLKPYGLAASVALWTRDGGPLPPEISGKCMEVDAVADADLLINVHYRTPVAVLKRFRRSALIDIDPGLLQTWLSGGYHLSVPTHTHYFTTGETVGTPGAKFPDLGIRWHYVPPPICLEWWRPVHNTNPAPFTTISHWRSSDWLKEGDQLSSNEKRAGFLPFVDLPRYTSQTLELALPKREKDRPDWEMLEERGWRVRDSYSVSSTPWDYQRYIQSSRGEFSCVKPSCVRFQNAWISDRTLCYLASGKPAVIQHTGPSRILPDAAGMFRFHTLQEAASALEAAAADYVRQCRLARQLAEECFDAKKVVSTVLERALS